MKVTLINSSDSGGGAPVACRRLMNALNADQKIADLLVQQKQTSLSEVVEIRSGAFGKIIANADFLRERLPFIWFQETDKSVRFAFSPADTGSDISQHPLVKNADILHLHWTNRGFLSIADLRKLMDLNKPIVWTMHDMWTFTGGCHYSAGCQYFLDQCGNCPMLRTSKEDDLSRKGWLSKHELYKRRDKLYFVGCSNWMADMAAKSSLLHSFPVQTIPNPIDTQWYRELDRNQCRVKWDISPESKVLLFGAANINDKRKGLKCLLDALKIYSERSDQPVELIMFGKNTSFDPTSLPFKVRMLPLITTEAELIELYNLADIFVHPSLEDNLPNMVMESMACGTPVLAFQTGGLPDLIDHQHNGYLAEYTSTEDFANGIEWIFQSDYPKLRIEARNKVLATFSNEQVAAQYRSLYQSILKHA